MICRKCHKNVPDAPYCCLCGFKQDKDTQNRKKRGNGQGSVYKLTNGKYKAVHILSYYVGDDDKVHKITRSKVFDKKVDAINALPSLQSGGQVKKKEKTTFKQLYDKWFPTHRAGKGTMDCYKAAMAHFKPVWHLPMNDIDIDDLQDCLDSCGKGKRTQQNMKAMCGLVYKYGIPRNCTPNNLNLAQFLVVGGEDATHRDAFTDKQIDQIRKAVGTIDYADYIYCLIYLGFRPSEFLSLTVADYDKDRECFIHGAKTEAGINRVVTISPKILPIIQGLVSKHDSGALFTTTDGKKLTLDYFTDNCFYPALDGCGIENPMVTISGGVKRHKYTPHSCRHTFATLMKRVDAPSKDKQELIGHASEEQLKYYQDVDIADLKRITDLI